MCYSMSVLQPSTLRRNCTEHKPGYLHAATQWTHIATATATPLHLTHMNVTTNVNGMSFCYDFYVKSLHFDYMLAKSVTVKSYYILQKIIHKIVFSWWNVKVSGVYNLSALCGRLEWLSTCPSKHKRGAVIAKNVNLPPRLSYLRSSAFCCLLSCFEIHFNGPIIGLILMSDEILLILWCPSEVWWQKQWDCQLRKQLKWLCGQL